MPGTLTITTTLPSGNGHVETRTYDGAGRATVVRNAKAATVLSQMTRTLDPVGGPTLVATLRGATTTNEAMEYDVANRLTKWCQAATCTGATKWIRHTYDPVGNRKQQVRTGVTTPGTTNYTYNNADQLTAATVGTTTTNSTYDPDGNQLTQGTTTSTYDLAGQMSSVKIGTATATNYTYDGDGNRRTRATGTTVNTRYSWDVLYPLPELALERNASNALIRRYVHGPAGPISMATSPTATFYYHRDALGSITDVTSATGAAQWRYSYEPFGTPTATKVVTQAPANPVTFTGEYQATERLSFNLRARQYDPSTGRFGAVDPVTPSAVEQAVNPYAYVENRPGVLVDPSGLCSTYNHGDDPLVWRAYEDCMRGEDAEDKPPSAPRAAVDATGGALVGGADGVVNAGKALLDPDTYKAIVAQCRKGARTNFDIAGCVQRAVVDPAIDNVKAGIEAIKCGDYQKAGELLLTGPLLSLGGLGVAGAVKHVPKINSPPSVLRVGDVKLPAVPKGAVGSPTGTGRGTVYAIPRGTPELNPRVTAVRIMDPVTTGRHQYPNGYAVYMNERGQTVNPITGDTISNSDPLAHIPL